MGGGGGWVVCGLRLALSGEGMEWKGRVGNGPMLGTDGVRCWSEWWRVAGMEDSEGASGVCPGSAAQAGAHSASGMCSSDELTSTGTSDQSTLPGPVARDWEEDAGVGSLLTAHLYRATTAPSC